MGLSECEWQVFDEMSQKMVALLQGQLSNKFRGNACVQQIFKTQYIIQYILRV